MATALTGTAKKKGAPRVSKDKTIYLLAEGSIQNVTVVMTAEEALDAKEANANLTYKKVVIPAKKRPAANQVSQTV